MMMLSDSSRFDSISLMLGSSTASLSRPTRETRVWAALHTCIEQWLLARAARLLQVKTLADSHPSAEYAETRRFYASVGYVALEVFPTLWGPRLPVLQLVKALR